MIKDLPFTDFKTKSDYFVLKLEEYFVKGLFAKNERVYRLTEKSTHFLSLLIILLSVASIRRKLLKNDSYRRI